MHKLPRIAFATCLLIASAAVAAGCGGSDSNSSGSAAKLGAIMFTMYGGDENPHTLGSALGKEKAKPFKLKAKDGTPSQVVDLAASADGKHIVGIVSVLNVVPPEGKEPGTIKEGANTSGDQVWIFDADGSSARQLSEVTDRLPSDPHISPDGSTVVYTGTDSSYAAQLFLLDVDSGKVTDLPVDKRFDHSSASFTPDGKSLLYIRAARDCVDEAPACDNGIVIADSDGSGEKLLLSDTNANWPTMSLDGKQIAYTSKEPDAEPANLEIFSIASSGKGKPKNLTDSILFSEEHAVWSPDGKWIAFTSTRVEGSTTSVGVVKVGDENPTLLAPPSADSGLFPVWLPSSDGKKAFDLKSVTYDPDDVVEFGK